MAAKRESRDPPLQPFVAWSGGLLPYSIELWDLPREAVERVVARAAGAELARAIFAAAQGEYVGRLVTLNRGTRQLARSA
jgi:hypothetical protein